MTSAIAQMTYEEKGTWVYLVASTAAYAVDVAIVIARLASTPVADVSYVAVLPWTSAASILASVIGRLGRPAGRLPARRVAARPGKPTRITNSIARCGSRTAR